MGNQCEGSYVFQGNLLLVPAETLDACIHEPVNSINVRDLLNGPLGEGADDFTATSLDNSPRICALSISGSQTPAGWRQIPMRQAVSLVNAGVMVEGAGVTGRLLRAFHIAQWRKTSRFCGACGSKNNDCETEFARQCPSCGNLEFPRISPAIITIITNDRDEALLAHNKKFTSKIYALVAGFNEAGESLEATVEREIMEEVSIRVKDIRYVKSQPWPFPNSLMVGFSARHASGTIKADNVEIEDARWFSRDNLPDLPLHGSVSRYLIDLWLQKKL